MERRIQRRIETFMMKTQERGFTPVYLFSQADSESIPGLILDISEGGCKLLLPKKRQSISSRIRLKIQDSENLVDTCLDIEARQAWSDPDYSIEHEAIGLKFTSPNQQPDLINQLLSIFVDHNQNEQFFRCEVVPLA